MDEKARIYNKVKSIIGERDSKSSYIGEDDFVSLTKNGVNINFHIKNPNINIENVFRTVKRAQKIINERLGYNPDRLHIDIYNSIGELRKVSKSKSRFASWIAGIYDGRLRVISDQEDEEPEALYIILTHEIVHLAVDEMSRGLCPYWLDEGLAIFLSQDMSDTYIKALHDAVKNDKIIPLEILEKPLPSDTEELIRHLVYTEVFSIVEYFIAIYGWSKIKSVIEQCKRRPIKTILTDLGLNYYLIVQGWMRWMRERYA